MTWNLNQTCRYLCGLTTDRVLWLRILRAFRETWCIPSATYDISAMSISELEAATCNPIRFQRILHGKSSKYDIKTSTIPLSLPLGHQDYTDPSIDLIKKPSGSRLLPGGRFLVSLDHGPSAIQCWDLHQQAEKTHGSHHRSDSTIPIGRPLSEWSVGMDPAGPDAHITGVFEMQQVSDDADSFNVILCTEKYAISSINETFLEIIYLSMRFRNWRNTYAIILRLTLSSDPARPLGFSYLRSRQLQRPIIYGAVELKGDFAVFKGSHREIVLWNWVEDTWGVMTSTPQGQVIFSSKSTDPPAVNLSLRICRRWEAIL
ncbi:hypothetical protein DL93DRAFT_1857648 [Clavulina sp. PMI_390]|nr:hypothetical protein DL93DRAFT_1857648 [Clavulina sp. PMI_390]